MKTEMQSMQSAMGRMRFHRKVHSQILVLILIVVNGTAPVSAQFNLLHLLNILPIFGGVQINNRTHMRFGAFAAVHPFRI
jgi:ABC-type maltose transport system permease subunit